jgi:hypothetical protein
MEIPGGFPFFGCKSHFFIMDNEQFCGLGGFGYSRNLIQIWGIAEASDFV